jgi:hypothetical protein
MLNMVAMAEAAVPTAATPTCARSRMGTWLACAHTPVPRSRAKADIFGSGSQVAGAAMTAAQQHFSKVNYAHTTRIAALKGGALGPHPARDPV